jgi:HD domain
VYEELSSEHAVGVRARDVRGDDRSGVLACSDRLQRVPVLDRLPIGVHLIDIDARDAGIGRIVGEQVQEVHMGPDVVADGDDPVNDDPSALAFARDLGEELPERDGPIRDERSHHERWDGSGYPKASKGEQIPLSGRIMNICDQYDALRSKRPYKEALDHASVMNIITEGDGRTLPTHFEPRILECFVRLSTRFQEIFEANRD